MLNSNEIWEESSKNGPTTKSKDDAKSMANKGAEITSSSSSAEENPSTKSANSYQHSIVFDSSSSFEIGSSENHWHSQKQIGGYDFSTSFPLPHFPRVSPKINSGSRESSTVIAPSSTIGPSVRSKEEATEQQQKSKESLEDDQCCACIHGPPGPPGIAGADGLPGRDGRPGQNGLSGHDAPQAHKPSIDDFCFSCPQGPAGESGPEGCVEWPMILFYVFQSKRLFGQRREGR